MVKIVINEKMIAGHNQLSGTTWRRFESEKTRGAFPGGGHRQGR